eukprot:1619327-Pleurochrysis_carterae.AAC.2
MHQRHCNSEREGTRAKCGARVRPGAAVWASAPECTGASGARRCTPRATRPLAARRRPCRAHPRRARRGSPPPSPRRSRARSAAPGGVKAGVRVGCARAAHGGARAFALSV